MINQKSKKKELFILISSIAFLAILALNFLSFKIADDFYYSLSNSISDIFQKEYIQYMTWGGRSVAHIFARITLSLPSIIFKIVNSLLFMVLIFLIYFHSTGNKKIDNPHILSIILCCVFLFTPVFGQVFLWQTGSSNYLWMTTIILWFLLPYRLQLEADQSPSIIVMFFLGVLAGWSNENTGGACVLLLILLVAYEVFQNKKSIQKWMISGFIGSTTGFLFMVLAPGNFTRYGVENVASNGLLYNLTKKTNDLFSIFQNELLLLILLTLTLFTLLLMKNKKKLAILTSIYFITAIATVLALVASPSNIGINTRPIFGAVIFLVISIALASHNCFKEKEFQSGINILLSILIFLTLVQYPRTFMDLLFSNRQNAIRDSYVNTQLEQGNLDPIVFQLGTEFRTTYNPAIFLEDFSYDSNHWVNTTYSEFKGINSISVTSFYKWNLIYKEGDPLLMSIQSLPDYLTALESNSNFVALVVTTETSNFNNETIKLLNIDVLDSYLGGLYGNLTSQSTEFTLTSTTESFDFNITGNNIAIDGITYTNGNDGISFVVYDQSKGQVVDSVTFDETSHIANRGERGY